MVYYIEFDIAAVVLFFVLIATYFARKHFKDRTSLIYISLVFSSLFTAIADMISAVSINRHMNKRLVEISSSCYYLFLCATTFLFLSYVIYHLESDEHLSNLKKHIFRLPILYYALLVLTNGITGWIFSYSVEEGYAAGPLQGVSYIITLLYFFFAGVYVFFKRKMLESKIINAVLNVSILNVTVAICQYIFPAHLLLCFGLAVSMIVLAMSTNSRDMQIDQKTGMMNRDSLAALIERLYYNENKFTAVFVRVADYDQLSNIYGIQLTDELTAQVAQSLIQFVGIGKSFQTNNSTFVLIFDNNEKALQDITTIEAKLASNWEVEGQAMPFSYLITHVSVPLRAKSKDAFIACLTYFEKMKRMRYGIVPPEELAVRDKVRETVVERAIIDGLKDGNLSVFYQPICTTQDQKFISAEALVRLKDPELGYVSPAEFIPVAEKSGLMIDVGNYVLDQVCQFINRYDMKDFGLEYIEVNLSVVQCLQRDFMQIIDEKLKNYKVDPSNICFEITETAANCSPEIFTSNLNSLVEKGFRLALDDFGSGYGNLERMVTSSFFMVKFDKGMTDKICSSERMRVGFSKMVPLFKMLNLHVVSEGVETEEQYEYLKGVGVDYLQGYLFAKPMPERPFADFLLEHLK